MQENKHAMTAANAAIIPFGKVLAEARDKFPGLTDEAALREYIFLCGKVMHFSESAVRKLIAEHSQMMAGHLHYIFTIGRN